MQASSTHDEQRYWPVKLKKFWDSFKKFFRRILRISGFVFALVLVFALVFSLAVGVPVFGYWRFTDEQNWGSFWERAATPMGAFGAGCLAVLAAVIAFFNGHRQRKQDSIHETQKQLAEKRRDLRARFSTAIVHLADDSDTIQQGGVYSLAALADDWINLESIVDAQVCIDVLCSYLRTHHHTIAKKHDLKFDKGFDYLTLPDMTIRTTIMHVVQQHLVPENGVHGECGKWSHLNFSFTRAPLPEVNFGNAVFSSRVGFGGARFTEGGSFEKARFTDVADFGASDFNSDVSFYGVTFSQHAVFSGTQFYSQSNFSNAKFIGQAYFEGANFWGSTSFQGATFNHHVDLRDAALNYYADFRLAAFTAGMSLDGVIIDGSLTHDASNAVDFSSPRAWREVSCEWKENIDKKPERVRPDQWPPILATPETQNAISLENLTEALNPDGGTP